MVPAEKLAEVFVQIADTLVDEFDLIEFLQMVTTHTSDLVEATAAGVLLADQRSGLQLMAASDERARVVELFQIQANEGPCQECFRRGEPVSHADLARADSEWPRFAPMAVATGFRSVHAFPLRLRGNVIGALNIFGTEVGQMPPGDVRVIQALADVATIGLMQERAIRRGELLTEQLQSALDSRVVIEQAKGVLAQIHGIGVDEAFALMRGYSRDHGMRLGVVAREVTTNPSAIPGLTSR